MGTFDVALARAEALAETFGARGFDDYLAFLDVCDAVVIAVPATWHEPLARVAIEAYRHVLVEKPLALTGHAARDLADDAAARGRILQVGHRTFRREGDGRAGNPEVLQLIGPWLLPINAGRAGRRCLGDRDLMIHDLDLAAMMLDREFTGVGIRGARCTAPISTGQGSSPMPAAAG